MKIAMIGQKGMPALWGGIERHVEELAIRLAAKGHAVLCFAAAGIPNHRRTPIAASG